MKNTITTINEIKNYIAVKEMTKAQLEATVNWLTATANNHFNGTAPLDEETFYEVTCLFDGLSCDFAYGIYDEDEDEFDRFDECNVCDVAQIGGICTEKNCKHCINHSGFCPVDE